MMRGIKILLVFCLTLLIPEQVFAITNGNDELLLKQPAQEAIVAGQTAINWFMKDPDQTNISFQIDLFNQACSDNGNFFGIITSGQKQLPVGGSDFTENWDTDGPIQSQSSIPDGLYCLRVCPIFRRAPNDFYSFCDKHTVIVGNINKPPKITSNPAKLDYKVGESFSYQIMATDPDGDKINYQLITAPSFLQINANGLISSKGALQAAGTYAAKVRVDDGKGMKAEQSFTIKVTEVEKTLDFNFSEPKPDAEIEDSGTIKWSVAGNVEIVEITISYSTDKLTWTELTKLPASARDYTWVVNDLPAGEYYLRLQLKDKDGKIYEKISEKFTVAAKEDTTPPVEEIPLISSLTPEADAEVTEKKPEISAQIQATAGAGLTLEKISVKLDDNELTNCQLEETKISCIPESDLEDGKHMVTLVVEDSKGKKAVKEWQFDIKTDTGSGNGGENVINIFGRNIPSDTFTLALLILCAGLILLIIPWLIYVFIVRRRRESYSEVNIQPPPAAGYQVYDYAPEQTVTVEPSPYMEPAPYVQPVVIDNVPENQSFTYEPSIGSQTIAAPAIQPETSQPAAFVDAPPIPETVQPQAAPLQSAYADTEIPEWLKQTADSSQPVSPSGQGFQVRGEENTQSSPYGDYGLAQQNDTNPNT